MRWILMAFAVSACSATQCREVSIDIHSMPGKPKPAGVVVIGCDGRKLVVIEADKVGP